MMMDSACGAAAAKVRVALVPRDRVSVQSTVGASVFTPIGPARLWGQLATVVQDALGRACENQPQNSTLPARCAEHAARAISYFRSRLIEPNLTLDGHLGVAVFAPKVVHLALTGGVRAYRVRNGTVERLQQRAEEVRALGESSPMYATESFDRGDWFLLGTAEAFSLRSIGALSTLLGHGPDSPAKAIVDGMLGPAHDSQAGGALAVFRLL
jgi:hypothetical protein